jgi:hypothetical protein
MSRYRSLIASCTILIAVAALVAAPVVAKQFGAWSPAQSLESLGGSSEVNTASLDGCPIQSPDGLDLYMATNRPGGLGGIDIWVASRSSTSQGFGAPANLGAPINSSADDFCPTPVPGKGLFFVSSRAGGCGTGADIYLARNNPAHGWTDPVHLGCVVNSAAGEASPSYFEEDGQGVLYFSSNRIGISNIYRSLELADGSFGTPAPVAELNTGSEDARPNLRRDGLEIVFDSTRPGGLGGPDIYAASRASVGDAWSAPINLGPDINSGAADTRGSLSADGRTLLFGSGREGGEGSSDIYFSTRERLTGQL